MNEYHFAKAILVTDRNDCDHSRRVRPVHLCESVSIPCRTHVVSVMQSRVCAGNQASENDLESSCHSFHEKKLVESHAAHAHRFELWQLASSPPT